MSTSLFTWSIGLSLFFLSPAFAAGPPNYPLPSYVKHACSRNDPNLNKCVVEVGGPAIKSVVKGDPKYRIPQLDPLVIDELRINQGTKQVGLQLVCTKCLLSGLQHTNFYKANINWKTNKCQWYFTLDKLSVRGKYNVTGKVLLLPIFGSGIADIKLENMTFTYDYGWKYIKKSNGLKYVNITQGKLDFNVGFMQIYLENLFNGDKLLGGNMNRFLNEHWREILKDIKPAISDALGQLAGTILSNMAALVPFDNMFPEKIPPQSKSSKS